MHDRILNVQLGSRSHRIEILAVDVGRGTLRARIDDEEIACGFRLAGPDLVELCLPGGETTWVRWARLGQAFQASVAGGVTTFTVQQAARQGAGADGAQPPEVTPPIPAVVAKVLVLPGQQVEKGQPVVVVTAMKMETTLRSPKTGTVREVRAREGDRVSPGQVLVTIDDNGQGG